MYQNVIINYAMSSFIPDKFIFDNILSKVVIIKTNILEYWGHVVNLEENNEENNLHYIIGSAGINESGILSDFIYYNVNKSRQNQYFTLISAIHNFSDNNAVKDHNKKPRSVISYNFHDDKKVLNSWNNPDLFLIAFSTLLFHGKDSYISP